MKTITLGSSIPGGHAVHLDVAKLVESRLLVQANSGGGKSWLLRRLLERTHGMVQHLVLDIEGEFHTLREKYDYVLVAKSGGEVVADVRLAGILAHRLLEMGVSAVIDLYELKKPERVRFVKAFLEALVEAPKKLWHPVLVVVDEAHQYCPQNGNVESADAVIDLMTRGRKRGLCGVLATQRLSKLHKDAAAEANIVMAGRVTLDVDRKRAEDLLGFTTAEDKAKLRRIPPGKFFAFGPGLSDEVVEVQVGGVETTPQKAGEHAAPVPPPREKIRKVLEQLADLPKEAEAELKTMADLKAEVVRLKRERTEARLPMNFKSVTRAPEVRVVEKRVEVKVPHVPSSL